MNPPSSRSIFCRSDDIPYAPVALPPSTGTHCLLLLATPGRIHMMVALSSLMARFNEHSSEITAASDDIENTHEE